MSGIISTSDYLYLPGSGLEVPGLEAILEYGDASKTIDGHVVDALRINDRSAPDQVHLTAISGLHDDPDGRDSRINNADRHGERAGLMLYGGRTIGLTGRVQAGNINRMRDLWRRLRSQFGVIERDLLIHPVGEVPLYTNVVPNPSFEVDASNWGWSSGSLTGGVAEGSQRVGQLVLTGLVGSTTSFVEQFPAVPWNGRRVYVYAMVKVASATATVSAMHISAAGDNGGEVAMPDVVAPTTGTWYALSGVIAASDLLVVSPSALFLSITVDTSTSGNVTLLIDRAAMVFLDDDDPVPIGWVDGTAPGSQWSGLPNASASFGPSFAVNQIADSTCTSPASWTAVNDSGVTVNRGPASTKAWAGSLTDSSILYWPVASASGKKMSIAAPATLVVAGHTYRLTAKLNVNSTDVGHTDAVIVWQNNAGTTLSTSSQSFAGAGVFDVSLSAVAPAGAYFAQVRFGNITNLTTGAQQSIFALADPCLLDVTYADAGPFCGLGPQEEEIAVIAGGVPDGARRRIIRPFLIKGVRKTSDMKAPEEQVNLQARRPFTMSLRAADPRIYVVDERRASLKLAGSPQFVSKQSEVFTLETAPAAVPTGFTYEGQSIPSTMAWTKTPAIFGASPYPNSGVSPKLWSGSAAIAEPGSDVVARAYRTAESYVYAQPRVTLGCSPVGVTADSGSNSFGRQVNSAGDTIWNNSARILLKRVSSTTWLELRWYTGSHASSVAGWVPAPADAASPYTFELWCSHNTSGALAATRLAQADYASYPISYLQPFGTNVPFNPQTQPMWLVSYMLSNVVYWELWTTHPSSVDFSTRIESGSYTLPSALQTVVGSSVTGSAGFSLVVPKADSTTWSDMAFDPPFVHYFEARKADVAPSSISVPVIGDVNTPEVITLRGDMVNPTLSMSTPNEDGTTTSSFARFIGTMAEANPVSIDMATGAITDSQGNNAYSQLQPGGSFSTLRPGANLLVVSAENWSTTPVEHVSVSWRDALA